MEKYELSFAKVNIIDGNIAEVIVDPDVVISLEMSEEYDNFFTTLFEEDFGFLINKVNKYDFSFEAKISMASHANLIAIAVITYDDETKSSAEEMATRRQLDGWNLAVFDGFNLGWQDGLDWLKKELNHEKSSS